MVVASPFHSVEDVGFAERAASVLGRGQLIYRAQGATDEVVCPGFPKLARRRDLAANVRGLEVLGFKRVGNDQGTGGVSEGSRALLVVGDDLSDLPANFGASAELFVYIGHSLSPAARNAHFVLPATNFAEQEGTFVNFEGRVQRFWPALQAPALARPAWQILGVLLAGLQDGNAPVSAAQAFARLGELHDAFAGISYDALGSRGALINQQVRITAGGGKVR